MIDVPLWAYFGVTHPGPQKNKVEPYSALMNKKTWWVEWEAGLPQGHNLSLRHSCEWQLDPEVCLEYEVIQVDFLFCISNHMLFCGQDCVRWGGQVGAAFMCDLQELTGFSHRDSSHTKQ